MRELTADSLKPAPGAAAFLPAVAAERAGRGELAELVPDHVFLHEHLQELVPVVHLERVAHELRDDRARPGPGLDGLLGAVLVQLRDLLVELLVDERAFFCASAHVVSPNGPAVCAPLLNVTRSRSADAAGACRTCGGGGSASRCASSGCRVMPPLDGHARLADRVTPAVAAAFAAAQRVVDRVHRLGTGVRADAHVAAAAGLADADVDPVEVAELADRRAAGAADAPHFAGRQDDDGPVAFLRAEAGDAAGRADQLAALAGVHLDVVDFQAAGMFASGRQLPSSGAAVGAADDRRADLQAVGGEDVGLLAVLVLDQGDEARAVGVVLDRLDGGGDAVLRAA